MGFAIRSISLEPTQDHSPRGSNVLLTGPQTCGPYRLQAARSLAGTPTLRGEELLHGHGQAGDDSGGKHSLALEDAGGAVRATFQLEELDGVRVRVRDPVLAHTRAGVRVHLGPSVVRGRARRRDFDYQVRCPDRVRGRQD